MGMPLRDRKERKERERKRETEKERQKEREREREFDEVNEMQAYEIHKIIAQNCGICKLCYILFLYRIN
jgi:hypothetical protein